ncbi:NAD-dependent epimerase/dehydratase family protein [Larkinella sp. VNQ87]|uniref:NAD-dependent epimerase/dehydratase family protein n=1 Tax=Larkinella sp. VNQ87 TaxID=3400921 RepID=UPI003C055823
MSANPTNDTPTALLTGHNGFLGKYLDRGLVRAGYQVMRLGQTAGDMVCDLGTQQPDLSEESFELVIHAAGKAHSVPRTESEKETFFRVNGDGTLRLLRALDGSRVLPKAFVLISTVAVYGCEAGFSITEDISLMGKTPYAESKIQAEQFVLNWCQQRGVRYLILRLPLIVGDAAPGNLGKLVETIRRGRYVRIGSGAARRSMVLAEDVAQLIPKAVTVGGIYNLTDGVHPSVQELEEAIARQAGRRLSWSVPYGVARVTAWAGDGINRVVGRRFPLDSIALTKITSSLTFSDERARQQLGWKPKPVITYFS